MFFEHKDNEKELEETEKNIKKTYTDLNNLKIETFNKFKSGFDIISGHLR